MKKQKQKQKLKDILSQNHEILEALASKDKKALRTCGYVAYNDVIEFPKPCAFTIKRLKQLIKEVEKAKLKGNNLLAGIIIEIEMPKELKKTFKGKRKCFKVVSVKQKYKNGKK